MPTLKVSLRYRMEALMVKTRRTALSQIRKATGMTQAQIANQIGVSKATYSAWETGRSELTAERILALSNIFNCTPNELLGVNSPSEPFSILTENEEELLALYRAAPPNIRIDIIDILRTTTKNWRYK